MRNTRYQSQGNPQLAAGIDTTPRDYDVVACLALVSLYPQCAATHCPVTAQLFLRL
jgi:hypothetical protein